MTVEKSGSRIGTLSKFRTMHNKKDNKSQRRLVVALSLFSLSIFSSFLFSYLAQMGDSYWVTSRPLARGVQVTSADVLLRKMEFGDGVAGYLSDNVNPIGSITRRNIGQMQVIHSSDVSNDSNDLTNESVSISIKVGDIPTTVSIGDLVSLYQVYESRNGEEVPLPNRILSGVFVREISEGSANFGGGISLTLSITRDLVPELLAATSSGRIVVVATDG